MNEPTLWSQRLEKQTDIKLIIKELLVQIQKDFSLFGENISFSESTEASYQALFEQLCVFLTDIYSSKIEKLYPVLYRIDISEKDMKKAINQTIDQDFFSNIAELIILKELQKVIIRRYYKSKS